VVRVVRVARAVRCASHRLAKPQAALDVAITVPRDADHASQQRKLTKVAAES